MIIINMHHHSTAEERAPYINGHREFIKQAVKQGTLLFAGSKINTAGGILLTDMSQQDAEALMQRDPYIQNNVSQYTLIEFAAKVCHSACQQWQEVTA